MKKQNKITYGKWILSKLSSEIFENYDKKFAEIYFQQSLFLSKNHFNESFSILLIISTIIMVILCCIIITTAMLFRLEFSNSVF